LSAAAAAVLLAAFLGVLLEFFFRGQVFERERERETERETDRQTEREKE
jgi:hypothetical protein